VSTAGCDATTVSSDTAGTTFTCEATSAGGLHNDSLRGDNGKDTCRSGEVRTSSCEA
jgi:hypothetical protein